MWRYAANLIAHSLIGTERAQVRRSRIPHLERKLPNLVLALPHTSAPLPYLNGVIGTHATRAPAPQNRSLSPVSIAEVWALTIANAHCTLPLLPVCCLSNN